MKKSQTSITPTSNSLEQHLDAERDRSGFDVIGTERGPDSGII